MEEIGTQSNFKSHGLPLQRIKRIMKSNDDIKVILFYFFSIIHFLVDGQR